MEKMLVGRRKLAALGGNMKNMLMEADKEKLVADQQQPYL